MTTLSTHWMETADTDCRQGLFRECCPTPPPSGPRECTSLVNPSEGIVASRIAISTTAALCFVAAVLGLYQRVSVYANALALVRLGVSGATTLTAAGALLVVMLETFDGHDRIGWAQWVFLATSGVLMARFMVVFFFAADHVEVIPYQRVPVRVPRGFDYGN